MIWAGGWFGCSPLVAAFDRFVGFPNQEPWVMKSVRRALDPGSTGNLLEFRDSI